MSRIPRPASLDGTPKRPKARVGDIVEVLDDNFDSFGIGRVLVVRETFDGDFMYRVSGHRKLFTHTHVVRIMRSARSLAEERKAANA